MTAPRVRVVVAPPSIHEVVRRCSRHASGDAIADGIGDTAVVNRVGRLRLADRGCPACAVNAIRAGRLELDPEATAADGSTVPLADLREGANTGEDRWLDALDAARADAGREDATALLRALRRVLADPESPESAEVRGALRELCADPAALEPASDSDGGVFKRVRRSQTAA